MKCETNSLGNFNTKNRTLTISDSAARQRDGCGADYLGGGYCSEYLSDSHIGENTMRQARGNYSRGTLESEHQPLHQINNRQIPRKGR